MGEVHAGAKGLGERLREELVHYLLVSANLFVCLGAIQLYKSALLAEEGVRYLPFGFALAKSLILGKFLLIGESVRIGTRVSAPTLLHRIAARVLFMFALLLVLSVAEEVLVGAVHGKSMALVFTDYFRQRSLAEVAATSLLMLLVLVPLIVVEDVDKALRPGGLRALLLARPGTGGAGGRPEAR
jgi:hypothetical protein